MNIINIVGNKAGKMSDCVADSVMHSNAFNPHNAPVRKVFYNINPIWQVWD